MRRYLVWLALLLAVALALCGCGSRRDEAEAPGEIPLPEPSPEPTNMILGEQLADGLADVSLCYPAADGTGFTSVTRSVLLAPGASLPEATLQAMLGSGGTGFPSGDVRLLSCEDGCGLVTANLSIDARGTQNPQELLACVCAIGNTLLELEGVEGACVLIGGRSEGFFQLPLGIQTEPVSNVTAAYAQLQAERDRLTTEGAQPVTRTAAIYFPTDTGDWLVPELREISGGPDSFVLPLLNALRAGPTQRCAVASIPESAELLDTEPDIETLSSGERVLTLNFSSSLANYMAISGLEPWKLAGSVSLTMCGFLPELDGVRIMINGDPIASCELNDRVLSFPGGIIRREHFAERVGGVGTLYLMDDEGALQPVQRAMSMRSVFSPRSLILELFRAADDPEAPLRFPVSSPLYVEDLLGVRVEDGIALVNLSSGFYRACQTLNAADERGVVYALVNTLCRLEGIDAVRFYIEGLAADTLAGSIYLKSPLLPNPGIVRLDDAPDTTESP